MKITFEAAKLIKGEMFVACSVVISQDDKETAAFDLKKWPHLPAAQLLSQCLWARYCPIPDDDENLHILEFVFDNGQKRGSTDEVCNFLFKWLRKVGAEMNFGTPTLRQLFEDATVVDGAVLAVEFVGQQ